MNFGTMSHFRPYHPLWERGPNPRHSMSFQCRKGLLNNPGENNCFVNSAVQVLWHLDVFRRSFRQLSGHQCMGNSCIFCALKVIFTQFQYSDQDALPPDALRKALAETFSDQERFQIGVMDDAAECFENILVRIHFHIASNEKEDMCNARHCIPHQKFAMTIVEQYHCTCGATSEPLPFSQMVHYVSTSALVAEATYAMQQPSPCYFGQLLRNAGARGEMDKECPSKCGRRVKASRTLTNAPDVVSIGLVWDSEKSDSQHIQNVVRSIGTSLYLPDLYQSIDPSRACDLHLVGVVCYYGKHYSTFFYNSKARLWVYFDDATVKEIGPHWQKVADKICRGRYQPLLLLYTNPNAEAIDASTAPRLKTMVPGHSWNNDPSPPRLDQSSRDYHQSDNYVGQDRGDGARGGWNHMRSQNKEKFQKQLKERRAITPTPGSTGYDKEAVQSTRRAITPGPENWYNGYQDSSQTGVHHDRKPSYLDAMETTEISQPDQGKQRSYSVHPELLRSASVPYTKSAPQSQNYQGVGYDNPVATGYDQTDDCGTGRPVTNESTQISLGSESAPMFKPVQTNWSAPSDQPVSYDSYTLSNSDQYRRPSIPGTQADRTIVDKRDELLKANDKQKKNSFKGGKGRRKVGADVIRYQTSSSFNFEGMEGKENSDNKSVKRMHSVDDEKSQGFVNKHDTPITSGLATLPRNRKAKKSVQDNSKCADYVPMHNQKNSSNYVSIESTPAVTNKPRVRPMSASNHNREGHHISRNNWDEELNEPIYIDRKAVEMILNRQNVQLKRQPSSSSAASKESQDSGHHSVVSSYIDYSHTKPHDRHTLKVDIPNADNVSIGSYKDSGYRSGDRNSASSISSLSMESPTVDTVAMYVKNGPSLNQQVRENRLPHGVHKKVRNVRSTASNEVSSFSSSVESLGSTQSGNHHVIQKPTAVNKGGAIVHEMFPDAKNDAERCELLCNHAEDLVDDSVVKEQTGDLHLALVLCTRAVDYFKQILDLNPVDQQMVQHAHMKHNMCVLRSRALHRRILAKQDGHSETSHDDYSSSTSTEVSNKSLQDVSQPVPVNRVSNSHPSNNPPFRGNPSTTGGPDYYQQAPGYHPVNGQTVHVTRPQAPGQRSLTDPNQNFELRDYAKCTPHAPSDVKLRPPLVPQNLQVTISQAVTVLEPNHSKQSSASSSSTIEVYATLPRKNKSPNESPEKNKNDIDVYRSYLSRQRSQANTSTQAAHSFGNAEKPKPTVPVRSDSLSPNSTPVKATALEAMQAVGPTNDNRNAIQPPGEVNPSIAGEKNTHSVLKHQNSQPVSGQSQLLHTNSVNQATYYQSRTDSGGHHMHPLVQQQSSALQPRNSQPKLTSSPAGIAYERRASNYDYPDKNVQYNPRPTGSGSRNINPDYDYPERYCRQVSTHRPGTYHSQPQQSYNQPLQQAQARGTLVPPYQPPSGQQHPPPYQQLFQRSRSVQPLAPPTNYRPSDQYQTSQHFHRSVSQPAFPNSQHQKQVSSRRPVEVIQPPDGVPVHLQTSSFSSNSSSNTVNSQQNMVSQSNPPPKSRTRPSSAVAANRRHPSQTSSNYHDPRELKVGGDLKRYKSTPSISVPSDHDPRANSADVSDQPNVSVKERLRALEYQQMDIFRKQQGWLSQRGSEGFKRGLSRSEQRLHIHS